MRVVVGRALLALTLAWGGEARAWSNHSVPAYRAFETWPEVASAAPVIVEPIEAFLSDQEPAIATLLAEQEMWARANLAAYPPLPPALVFKADPQRGDQARRRAFLEALRVAPDIKLALFFQSDPQQPKPDPALLLPFAAVDTLPEPPLSLYRFYRLDPGQKVAPLTVVATASDEPDYGTDINNWEDSPSEWGKRYGFGKLPFGNPSLNFSTQAPFHMGFYHQSPLLYVAGPFLKHTYPMLRVKQFSGLAALAFRSGHPYWGWRFAGNALHYTQDLTQPYHASVLPGVSTARMMFVNALAMAGQPRMKDEAIVLVSNRHLALEKYQMQLLNAAAQAREETAIVKALRPGPADGGYPAWSDLYVRDVVTAESFAYGDRIDALLSAAMPAGYVSDPAYDFGAKGGAVDLVSELAGGDAANRVALQAGIAELLGHFGAHSRNTVRGILKAAN
jgi:hypothetical protein